MSVRICVFWGRGSRCLTLQKKIEKLKKKYEKPTQKRHLGTLGVDGFVTISDDAPSSPNAGDLWWESDTGRLKVYYNDGDSAQWVDTASGVLCVREL